MGKKGCVFLLSGIVMICAGCTSTIGPKKVEAASDYQKQFEAAYR